MVFLPAEKALLSCIVDAGIIIFSRLTSGRVTNFFGVCGNEYSLNFFAQWIVVNVGISFRV